MTMEIETPHGWAICTIDTVVAFDGVFADGDWVESKDQDPNGDVRLIQLADIGDGEFRNKSAHFLTKSKACDLNCTFLSEGDLLVARMPDPLGRCCIFPLAGDEKYVTVVDVCAIRLGSSPINHKYIMYLVNSPEIRAAIAALQSGSTRKRISRKNLATIELPIAPINEQHRIVAKTEELFSELDKGIESLKTAREQLKVYRQAVLKHAFEGKLTAQWREENKDKLETADQLLARIQKEREARYQQQLEEWQSAVKQWRAEGKKGKKPTRPRKPNWHESSKGSCDIPNSWIIVRCENLAHEVTDGDHQAPPKTDHGIPFITISNIDKNRFKVDFSNTFFVGHDYYDSLSSNRKAKKGDILYTVTGSFGIPVIVDFNKDFCFQRHIGLISPVELIDTVWFFNLLRSPIVFQQAKNKATGTAQKTVALSSLREFDLPLCSIEEQREISAILEQQLSTIENLERNASEQLMKSEALRQSILKKAFSGQLVPQDPNDEPASVLLERIKAEKAKQTPKPRGKRKPRKAASA